MPRRRVGGLAVALGVAGLVLLLTVTTLLYRDPDEACYRVVPPAGAAVSESLFPSGKLMWFPLGLQCSFASPTGDPIVVGPEPLLTILLLACIAISLFGLIVLISKPNVQNSSE